MKQLAIFVMVFLFIPFISGACGEGQIDINSASLEKLDELYGIGPVKAEAIINSRPFNSVDDLTEVSGIGEITLDKIKEQGLACVGEESEENDKETEEIIEETPLEIPKINLQEIVEKVEEENIPIEAQVIILNAKTIKSEDEKESLDKSDYAKYGFIVFCALLVFLFILKARRKRHEFED